MLTKGADYKNLRVNSTIISHKQYDLVEWSESRIENYTWLVVKRIVPCQRWWNQIRLNLDLLSLGMQKKKNQINALNNYKRITFRIIYLFGKLVLVFRNLPANSKHRLQKRIAISYKKTPEKRIKKSRQALRRECHQTVHDAWTSVQSWTFLVSAVCFRKSTLRSKPAMSTLSASFRKKGTELKLLLFSLKRCLFDLQ